MHAYVFIGRRWWGFTHDESAANLPADHGPWSFFRNAIIDDDAAARGEEEAFVAAALTAHGLALLPARR